MNELLKNDHDKMQGGEPVRISIQGSVDRSAVGIRNVVYNSDASQHEESITAHDFVTLLKLLQVQVSSCQEFFQTEDASDINDSLAKAIRMSQRDTPPVDRIQQQLNIADKIIEKSAQADKSLSSVSELSRRMLALCPCISG